MLLKTDSAKNNRLDSEVEAAQKELQSLEENLVDELSFQPNTAGLDSLLDLKF